MPNHRQFLVFTLLWIFLSGCVSLNSNTDPTWLSRLDPGGPYHYHEAKWSPDSKEIVYTRRDVIGGDPVSEKLQSSEIFIMNVDTHAIEQLTSNDPHDSALTW